MLRMIQAEVLKLKRKLLSIWSAWMCQRMGLTVLISSHILAEVVGIQICNRTLEDYFQKVTGGESFA